MLKDGKEEESIYYKFTVQLRDYLKNTLYVQLPDDIEEEDVSDMSGYNISVALGAYESALGFEYDNEPEFVSAVYENILKELANLATLPILHGITEMSPEEYGAKAMVSAVKCIILDTIFARSLGLDGAVTYLTNMHAYLMHRIGQILLMEILDGDYKSFSEKFLPDFIESLFVTHLIKVENGIISVSTIGKVE